MEPTEPTEPTEPLSDAYKNASISQGTLRTADLLSNFGVVVGGHSLTRYYKIMDGFSEMGADETWEELADRCPEVAEEILEEFVAALEEMAPEGCYFGAHPGDGADFGFWEVEDDGEE